MVHYLLVPAAVISGGQHPQRSALCDISAELKITCTQLKEMRGKSKVQGGVFFKKFPDYISFFFFFIVKYFLQCPKDRATWKGFIGICKLHRVRECEWKVCVSRPTRPPSFLMGDGWGTLRHPLRPWPGGSISEWKCKCAEIETEQQCLWPAHPKV